MNTKSRRLFLVLAAIIIVSLGRYLYSFNPYIRAYLNSQDPLCLGDSGFHELSLKATAKNYQNPETKIRKIHKLRNCDASILKSIDQILLTFYEINLVFANDLNTDLGPTFEYLIAQFSKAQDNLGRWDFYWQMFELLQQARGSDQNQIICSTIDKMTESTSESHYNLVRLLLLLQIRCSMRNGHWDLVIERSQNLETKIILDNGRPRSQFESRLLVLSKELLSIAHLARREFQLARSAAEALLSETRKGLQLRVDMPRSQVHYGYFLILWGSESEIASHIRLIENNEKWMDAPSFRITKFGSMLLQALNYVKNREFQKASLLLESIRRLEAEIWTFNQLNRVRLGSSSLESIITGNQPELLLKEHTREYGHSFFTVFFEVFLETLKQKGAK